MCGADEEVCRTLRGWTKRSSVWRGAGADLWDRTTAAHRDKNPLNRGGGNPGRRLCRSTSGEVIGVRPLGAPGLAQCGVCHRAGAGSAAFMPGVLIVYAGVGQAAAGAAPGQTAHW